MEVTSFWNSSPADVYEFVSQARQSKEQDQQMSYEIARWVSRFILTPHSKKSLKLQDLARFPWETPDVKGPPTKEELERWARVDQKYGIPTVDSVRSKRRKKQTVNLAKIARQRNGR